MNVVCSAPQRASKQHLSLLFIATRPGIFHLVSFNEEPPHSPCATVEGEQRTRVQALMEIRILLNSDLKLLLSHAQHRNHTHTSPTKSPSPALPLGHQSLTSCGTDLPMQRDLRAATQAVATALRTERKNQAPPK